MPCDVSDATAGLDAVVFVFDIIVEMAIISFFYLTAAFFPTLFFISRSVIFLVVSIASISDEFP